jgi:cytochrome c
MEAVIPPPGATGSSSPESSGNIHDPAVGRDIYAEVCVICHGENGNNEGIMMGVRRWGNRRT